MAHETTLAAIINDDDRCWERVGFLRAALEHLAAGDSVPPARWLELYAEIYPKVESQ